MGGNALRRSVGRSVGRSGWRVEEGASLREDAATDVAVENPPQTEDPHSGQNSFSVISALIGRRRRKQVCGACSVSERE